jgi:arylsulfatase
MYWQDWAFRRSFVLVPAQSIVGGLIKSFEEYPPRNKPASFSVGNALKMLETAPQGK